MGDVEISARQTDEHLYIVVEDDGPGIPLSKREVIFDRGQRVDTLRPGQGVGLAVAREITEQYEGKIVAGEIFPTFSLWSLKRKSS